MDNTHFLIECADAYEALVKILYQNLTFIIKIYSDFCIDLLSTDKILLKEIIGQCSQSPFIIKNMEALFGNGGDGKILSEASHSMCSNNDQRTTTPKYRQTHPRMEC
jgi:hypothetical protein